jgi:hypothetical protein
MGAHGPIAWYRRWRTRARFPELRGKTVWDGSKWGAGKWNPPEPSPPAKGGR